MFLPDPSYPGGSGPQGGSKGHTEGGAVTLCRPGARGGGSGGGATALQFQAGELCFSPGAGLGAQPGAAEQEDCPHSKSQADNSRRHNFSVFQFSKIERIKQIRADVPTCNYQLISLDFFFKKKRKFQNSSQISSTAAQAEGWLGWRGATAESCRCPGWGREGVRKGGRCGRLATPEAEPASASGSSQGRGSGARLQVPG